MVNKAKDKIVDPYASVRRDTAPPGKIFLSRKDYNRKKEKGDILKELEEMHDEIDKNVQIL